MPAPLSEFTGECQRRLAEVCRAGFALGIPGVDRRKQRVYHELVFDVFADALARAYPITENALSSLKSGYFRQNAWDMLIRKFVAEHRNDSPSLWGMPFGLYEYVRASGYGAKISAPWLEDLLHFEWTEIEVHMMPDGSTPECQKLGSLESDLLVLNPDFRVINLSFPVFRVKAAELNAFPGNYFLLCCRHRETFQVKFMEITPIHVTALEELSRKPMTLDELVERLSNRLNQKCDRSSLLFSLELLADQGMIAGYIPAQNSASIPL